VAPIYKAIAARTSLQQILVHTGQHYDVKMSDVFFSDLGLPAPDVHLGVGSGSHAQQTARMMVELEKVFLEHEPDLVSVVGDVNSTIACALVASKLKESLGCRIAHVEAGLRSHDWRMPEEVNRVLTDRLSDLLLTPSRDAHPNLLAEGIPAERAVFVGNVMIDTLVAQLPAARALDVPGRLGLSRGGYALATLHRPSNVDDPANLGAVLGALQAVSRELPVVLPLHPRTRGALREQGLAAEAPGLRLVEPLGYLDMVRLEQGAALVATDSGGVQKEAYFFGAPCVTLRDETEWTELVACGANVLVGAVADRIAEALARPPMPLGNERIYGDGDAAAQIARDVAALVG